MSPDGAAAGVRGAPRATYRLQLGPDRTFADAAAAVPYLASLGVSHLYLSPILQARPGSTHGYDVADPARVSDTLGGEDGLRALADAAHAAGLGLVADLVPNHLGTGASTPLWESLLAGGQRSEGARAFDVDWHSPLPGAAGKVILPVLGEPYGDALHAGHLRLHDSPEGPRLTYHDHSFPLSAESRAALERAGGADALRGTPGQPATWSRMHSLLEMQHYRLVYWRAGAALVNYRRFFAIDELAAVRVEDPHVYDLTHATIVRLVRDGVLDGLRIDHPDGLADPAGYLRRLAADTSGAWIVVEKILARHEHLPQDWPVAGTTGYDLAIDVLGLFVDPDGLDVLDQLARDLGALPADGDWEVAERAAKAAVLAGDLRAETGRLARDLWTACQEDLSVRDTDERACVAAVTGVLAGLDVYRPYVDHDTGGATDEDVARIEQAVDEARARVHRGTVPEQLWAFLAAVLTGRALDSAARSAVLRRFQQLAAATTAKGVEDTLLYRHGRLLAANEVGGDPDRPAVDVATFHRRMAARPAHGLSTTATHDTKRGEDVRVRGAALSELARPWSRAVHGWITEHAAATGPDAADLGWLYQTLAAAWPPGDDGHAPLPAVVGGPFVQRMVAYTRKAAREAERHTSWHDPDEAYEAALEGRVRTLLDADSARTFLPTLRALSLRAAAIGMVSGLAQVVLRCWAPGVPDTYQGTEWWDDSLVDPDNRRPVDLDARAAALAALDDAGDDAARAAALWARRRDGRVKQWVLAACLRLRTRQPGCAEGTYQPLDVQGRAAEHVVAFARGAADGTAVVAVVPRLVGALTDGGMSAPLGPAWEDTTVTLPGPGPWRDALAGAVTEDRRLPLARALARLPVAVLEPVS